MPGATEPLRVTYANVPPDGEAVATFCDAAMPNPRLVAAVPTPTFELAVAVQLVGGVVNVPPPITPFVTRLLPVAEQESTEHAIESSHESPISQQFATGPDTLHTFDTQTFVVHGSASEQFVSDTHATQGA